MARKIRIEYAGAAYHVMARGNQGRDIYDNERDRKLWLATLSEACRKTGWRIHARPQSDAGHWPAEAEKQPELERLQRRLEQVYENRNGEVEV
jgi:hypothetical protein